MEQQFITRDFQSYKIGEWFTVAWTIKSIRIIGLFGDVFRVHFLKWCYTSFNVTSLSFFHDSACPSLQKKDLILQVIAKEANERAIWVFVSKIAIGYRQMEEFSLSI